MSLSAQSRLTWALGVWLALAAPAPATPPSLPPPSETPAPAASPAPPPPPPPPAPAPVALPPAAPPRSGTPLPPGSTAYFHDDKSNYSQPDWMYRLSDDLPLNRISLPGTHASATFYGGDGYQTQSLSLRDQLYMGVRCLDLRCRHIGNGLQVYSGMVDQRLRARDFVNEAVNFLREHPTETIILWLNEEGQAKDNSNSLDAAFDSEIFSFFNYGPTASPFYPGQDIPTLGQVRGKIYILQSFRGKQFGRSYTGNPLVSMEQLKTNWDLYDKWDSVRKNLDTTLANPSPQEFCINALNGSGGSFPYFVASGKSSPQTGAPQLATGLLDPPMRDKYPDFPRSKRVLGIASIQFQGINPLADAYIRSKSEENRKAGRASFLGIVQADFPGPSLVDAIINANAFVR